MTIALDFKDCCKDCTKRHLHCHSECEDYKRIKEALNERNKVIREAKDREMEFVSYAVGVVEKQKKKKNKRRVGQM